MYTIYGILMFDLYFGLTQKVVNMPYSLRTYFKIIIIIIFIFFYFYT
jgi:hypothetical protein